MVVKKQIRNQGNTYKRLLVHTVCYVNEQFSNQIIIVMYVLLVESNMRHYAT